MSFTVQGYSKANQTAYAQDSLRVGADYLLKTFKPIPTTNASRPIYAMIYQVQSEEVSLHCVMRPQNANQGIAGLPC